jgi:hypothetical protein
LNASVAVGDGLGRLLLVVGLAIALALADLAVKAALETDARHFHDRSGTWVAFSYGLLLTAIGLARLPSRAVAIGAGLLAGGVAGNLLSARWYDGSVPNPLVVGDSTHGIAFNVADLFVLAGTAVLLVSLALLAIRKQDRLLPPRPWETALVRRLHRAAGRGRPRR